jgi:hypothetical protein
MIAGFIKHPDTADAATKISITAIQNPNADMRSNAGFG